MACTIRCAREMLCQQKIYGSLPGSENHLSVEGVSESMEAFIGGRKGGLEGRQAAMLLVGGHSQASAGNSRPLDGCMLCTASRRAALS